MKTIFYHVTHKKNIGSIMRHGLLLKKAQNKRVPWIWLDIEPCYNLLSHIAEYHGWREQDCVVLQVIFERDFCAIHPHKATFAKRAYKTQRDIPASAISLAQVEQVEERLAAWKTVSAKHVKQITTTI